MLHLIFKPKIVAAKIKNWAIKTRKEGEISPSGGVKPPQIPKQMPHTTKK